MNFGDVFFLYHYIISSGKSTASSIFVIASQSFSKFRLYFYASMFPVVFAVFQNSDSVCLICIIRVGFYKVMLVLQYFLEFIEKFFFFSTFNGRYAQIRNAIQIKDAVFNFVALCLNASFLVERIPVNFNCQNRFFADFVVNQKINMCSTVHGISAFVCIEQRGI